MWHAVTPVGADENYDPILYESPKPAHILVLNVGPADVIIRSWPHPEDYKKEPQIKLEMRRGEQRVVGGSLVRVHCSGFAAVAWRVLG